MAPTDDADLVRAAQAGDGHAFGLLFDRWSTRVLDVAYRIVRDREVAAEVAQDAFLAAWTGLDRLERAESFGGWVLRIGRNKALNRLERERRSIPVGDEETTDVLDRPTDPSDDAGSAAARSEDAALIWAAAAALGARDASVLDLHLRHGLSPGEIADELGVTANAAHQVLHRLRARLGDAVRACVLWRAGHPACAALSTAVADAGVTAFGADAVRVITAHATTCAGCTGRQEARLAPEALFAAIPLIVVGPEVLDAIRSGLADAGVPIDAPSGLPPDAAAGAPTDPAAPTDPPGSRIGSAAGRRRAAVAAAAGVLALVVVAILLLADDGGEPEEVAADGTTSSSTSASSTSGSRPAGSSSITSTTTAPGVSSLPAPTAPSSSTTTTTGPAADIGTASEPGLATNPPSPTTAPPPRPTTTTTTTTTRPAAAPPTISGFRVTRSPGAGTGCLDPSHRVAFVWSTAEADAVQITGRGAPGGTLAPDGTAVGCLVGAGSYTLTASGPGGSVTRSVSVPA